MRRAAALAALAALLLAGPLAASGGGIPVCPPGLMSCGSSGCYSSLLSACVDGQCRSAGLLKQLSLLVSDSAMRQAQQRCPMNYINACGTGGSFCGVEEVCTSGTCVPAALLDSSRPVSAAALSAHPTGTPLQTCLAARQASAACKQDATELKLAECNTLGVGTVPGVACFESGLFVCAAGGGQSPTYTCRGLALVAGAVREALNSTLLNGTLLNATTSLLNATTSLLNATVAAASANGTSGSSGGGVPLLQPVFQGLADAVANMSRTVFNISVPAGAGGKPAQRANLSSLFTPAAGQSSFNLVPPPGMAKSAALGARPPALAALAALLAAAPALLLALV